MAKPYIARVVSQKGGVGKTTIAVNLASAVRKLGYEVLLIDADTTNPSVGFHLGMEKANIGYRSLLYGGAEVRDVVAIHAQTGLHVIPGVVSAKPFVITTQAAKRVYSRLRQSGYQFIITDTQPGYTDLEISRYVDETLIVTTPSMPSLASALRVANHLDRAKISHSLVLNRYGGKRYELSSREIEEMYEGKTRAVLPEDEIVPMSIEAHIPAVELNRRARFSAATLSFGSSYSLNMGSEPRMPLKPGFLDRILRRLKR